MIIGYLDPWGKHRLLQAAVSQPLHPESPIWEFPKIGCTIIFKK